MGSGGGLSPPMPPSSPDGNVTSWTRVQRTFSLGRARDARKAVSRRSFEVKSRTRVDRQGRRQGGWRLRKDGNPSGAAFLGMVSISARAWLTRPKGPSRLSHRRPGQSLMPYPRPSSLSPLSGPYIARQGKTRERPRFLKRSRARVRLASDNGRLIQKASR